MPEWGKMSFFLENVEDKHKNEVAKDLVVETCIFSY